ncbi:hypothetical protein HPB47_024567 [Ixodes persulcatus]|uniref:Uncharacterized protein n=1 Tax=Ixodes persulcatus TaxID=34615 RepID=A0AC60Q405_IXOPE|nr:hypothetical protein HPB47_024567 [Ixodes persulcatus]
MRFRLSGQDLIQGETLLELGSGPVVLSSLMASSRFKHIVLSDLVEGNRLELNKWINKEKDAFDWSSAAEQIAAFEGYSDIKKGALEILERTRSTIRKVIPCDVLEPGVLPLEHRETFDVVFSSGCLDAAAADHESFRRVICNVAPLVKPGGLLVINGAGGIKNYPVGTVKFAYSNLTENVLKESVNDAGFKIETYRPKELGSFLGNSDAFMFTLVARLGNCRGTGPNSPATTALTQKDSSGGAGLSFAQLHPVPAPQLLKERRDAANWTRFSPWGQTEGLPAFAVVEKRLVHCLQNRRKLLPLLEGWGLKSHCQNLRRDLGGLRFCLRCWSPLHRLGKRSFWKEGILLFCLLDTRLRDTGAEVVYCLTRGARKVQTYPGLGSTTRMPFSQDTGKPRTARRGRVNPHGSGSVVTPLTKHLLTQESRIAFPELLGSPLVVDIQQSGHGGRGFGLNVPKPSAEGASTQAENLHCQFIRKSDLYWKSAKRMAGQSAFASDEEEEVHAKSSPR